MFLSATHIIRPTLCFAVGGKCSRSEMDGTCGTSIWTQTRVPQSSFILPLANIGGHLPISSTCALNLAELRCDWCTRISSHIWKSEREGRRKNRDSFRLASCLSRPVPFFLVRPTSLADLYRFVEHRFYRTSLKEEGFERLFSCRTRCLLRSKVGGWSDSADLWQTGSRDALRCQ